MDNRGGGFWSGLVKLVVWGVVLVAVAAVIFPGVRQELWVQYRMWELRSAQEHMMADVIDALAGATKAKEAKAETTSFNRHADEEAIARSVPIPPLTPDSVRFSARCAMRVFPEPSSAKFGFIPRGEHVIVKQRQAGWREVERSSGQTAWVRCPVAGR